MQRILVYGSRDFGAIAKQILGDCKMNFAGFIDDYYKSPEIIGNWDFVKENCSIDEYQIVIAIGYSNLEKRKEACERVEQAGFCTVTLIHPHAYIASTAIVHKGSIIMAKAVVDMRAQIGAYSVVWPGTVVNHDVVIGANVFLSPNSTICGYVTIGDNSFVGAGAVITDHVCVNKGSFIKAGKVFSANSPSVPLLT
jgi:sugar O-acyltransferase (sialic acid O-acetyltransferase NeuD family)